jgi:hypothetical protein
MKIHQGRLRILFLMIIFLTCFWLISPDIQPVQAGGYIDFEEGIDRQKIESSIPGLHFTTTDNQDWIYGDWRTLNYNGPYPNGAYYSNGNFFAWLGENQGKGRIDFTEEDATYLQVNVSSAYGLTGEAYDKYGQRIAISSVPANLNTGRMERLRLDAPAGKTIAYVELHDTGNYWLIDDLSTDASGVPATRPPVVLIPGLMGSVLNVYKENTGEEYEVWPPLYNSRGACTTIWTIWVNLDPGRTIFLHRTALTHYFLIILSSRRSVMWTIFPLRLLGKYSKWKNTITTS